jgi:hypothetical protein
VGRNKQLQRMHWDAFSSLFKGKKGGGAGKNLEKMTKLLHFNF